MRTSPFASRVSFALLALMVALGSFSALAPKANSAGKPANFKTSRRFAMLLVGFFVYVAAFPLSFQALFFALGSFRGALYQLGAYQFDHGLLRAIALAETESHDACVAAAALSEAGAQSIEQLLDRLRGFQKSG